jgi:hypothetical protein
VLLIETNIFRPCTNHKVGRAAIKKEECRSIGLFIWVYAVDFQIDLWICKKVTKYKKLGVARQ